MRNALERARLRQATRIVHENNKKLSKNDLMRIEAEDILASRVFDDEGDGPERVRTAATGDNKNSDTDGDDRDGE